MNHSEITPSTIVKRALPLMDVSDAFRNEEFIVLRVWNEQELTQLLNPRDIWYAEVQSRINLRITSMRVDSLKLAAPPSEPETFTEQAAAMQASFTQQAREIEGQRLTLEFATPSTKRIDSGRKSIEDSPLFGGDRQGSMF